MAHKKFEPPDRDAAHITLKHIGCLVVIYLQQDDRQNALEALLIATTVLAQVMKIAACLSER